MSPITLNELAVKENAVVSEISPSPFSTRLTEMGLYKGKQVFIKFKAPFGDPIAIDIEGSLLSLRLCEAQCIKVMKID